ncbi:MAG TPA: flagellar hook-basal body complex protein [Caulobacteraceae bacterium]|jgi:flagellar hook protein FlgE
MLGAIYIGLSGMSAYSKGLQTIGNNVANLNSVGFKATSISFQDTYSYLGGGYSSGSGSGVSYADPRINFSQGDLRETGGDLDLALQGEGFLVLKDGDKTAYGRTGQFYVDESGRLTLQGTDYHLAVLDEAGQPSELTIDTKRVNTPEATSQIVFGDNLSSTATTAEVSNITVFDSAGGKHTWKVQFAPVSASPGEWQATILDEQGATVGTANLKFSAAGLIDPTTSTATINYTGSGGDPATVTLDFAQVTSFSTGTTSNIRVSSADGHGIGELTGVAIDSDGQVKLTYSNGEEELVGEVALASFRDPQLLDGIGSGLFENRAGADHRFMSSGEGGVGRVVSGRIEASNVDLSEEFGNLILIQRGFQASSQIVSVTNDMIQQLFGIRGQG